MEMKNWTVRRTKERDALMQRVREKLKESGREVETIYDTPTTAAVIDEALKALDKELSKETSK